jgi:hypothetical protein
MACWCVCDATVLRNSYRQRRRVKDHLGNGRTVRLDSGAVGANSVPIASGYCTVIPSRRGLLVSSRIPTNQHQVLAGSHLGHDLLACSCGTIDGVDGTLFSYNDTRSRTSLLYAKSTIVQICGAVRCDARLSTIARCAVSARRTNGA